MDYSEKMIELEGLWNDSFELCKAMIESCKKGEMKLTGSILKELNAFIKQSVDFLRYREAEKAFDEKHDEEEALEEIDAMELPDIPEDLKFPEYTG